MLVVLAVVFYFVRRIVYSPFGQALTGIRENVRRMHAIGSPVHRRLVTVYTISAAIAGIAGALFTQTNAYVTLDGVRFRQFRQGDGDADPRRHRAALRRLHRRGGLHGLEDYLSKLSPTFWQFGIGLLLVLAVLFARRGVLGLLEGRRPNILGEEKVVTAALRSAGAQPRVRRAAGDARRRPYARARRAACADRAERRGQDDAGQFDHRRAQAAAPAGCCSTARTSPRFAGGARAARARAHLPDQPAVPRADGAGKSLHGHRRARRRLQQSVALGGLEAGRSSTRRSIIWIRCGIVDDALKLVRELPYGRQRLVEIAIALAQKPRVLLLDEPAAGVPSSESHLILDVVAALDPDIAVLIIEHDMDVVFRFAKEITVLVQGAVFTQGTPAEIMANERVRAVYLGQEARGGRHG